MRWPDVLAHFPQLRLSAIVTPDRELEASRPSHKARLRKADRVIEEYLKVERVLQIYVSRRGG